MTMVTYHKYYIDQIFHLLKPIWRLWYHGKTLDISHQEWDIWSMHATSGDMWPWDLDYKVPIYNKRPSSL